MENKSVKSFQDCRETEITGYNDCPSLLYVAKNERSRRIVSKTADRSGNTKAATGPPPSMKRKISDKLAESTKSCDESTCMSKKDMLLAYQLLVSKETKLKQQEFLYYRKKVESSLESSLEKDSARYVLTQVFNELDDQKKALEILTQWMLSDVTVGSWCPALRKLVENAII